MAFRYTLKEESNQMVREIKPDEVGRIAGRSTRDRHGSNRLEREGGPLLTGVTNSGE